MELSKCMRSRRVDGFTLVELIAVIGIVGVLLAVILLGAKSARNTSKISATTQQIQMIYSACQAWLGNGRVNYTAISMTALTNPGFLPATLTNPWGQPYTVAPGSDVSTVVITTSNIPDQYTHDEIAAALGTILVANSWSNGTSSFIF